MTSDDHRTTSITGRLLGGIPAVALGALSAVRGRRIFHPVGVAYEGRVRVPQIGPDVQILPVGEHDAVVRFSRGAGLPAALPDLLGVAVKLPRLGVAGGDQDLLLTSSGDAPGLRRLLVPRGGFVGRRFSSILAYRFEGDILVVGAFVEGADTRLDEPERAPISPIATVHLEVATQFGDWVRVASIEVGKRLPQEDADALRFDPWQTSEDLQPAGILNAARGPAYRLSQIARSLLGWREAERPDQPPTRVERIPLER
jgi:hypothetical protein